MKSFDHPVCMLNINPAFGNLRFPLFFCQRILLRGFLWNRTVYMNVLYPNKTFVRQSLRRRPEVNPAFTKQAEIVRPPAANRHANNPLCFRVDDEQQFQGMSLLFTGIVAFLFFLGRSVSHSVTSMITTSRDGLFSNSLLDGR